MVMNGVWIGEKLTCSSCEKRRPGSEMFALQVAQVRSIAHETKVSADLCFLEVLPE